jgi:hypothetical protein
MSQKYPSIIKFNYTELALAYAINGCALNVIRWWLNIHLQLKYDEELFERSIFTNERKDAIECLQLIKEAIISGKIDRDKCFCNFGNVIIGRYPAGVLKVKLDIWLEIYGAEKCNIMNIFNLDYVLFDKPHIMQWLYDVHMKLYDCPPFYTEQAVDRASEEDCIESLELWLKWNRNYGLELKYSKYAINTASANCNIDVLEFWKESKLPLLYSEKAIDRASSKLHLHILEWWFSSGLELKYSDAAVLKVAETAKCFLGCCKHVTISKVSDEKLYVPSIQNPSDIVIELYKYKCYEKSYRILDILRFWHKHQDNFGPEVKEILSGIDLLTENVCRQIDQELAGKVRCTNDCGKKLID